jgi:hypothetical protein
MRYKHPELFRIFPSDSVSAACANGEKASTPPSCTAGPEAGAGGCGSGAAAGSRCLSGSAAGTKCDTGVCFE